MLELYSLNYELLNTKERVTIDLIKDGQEFLEGFDINPDFLIDTTSVIYRFLRINGKIPQNLYKFYIAAYREYPAISYAVFNVETKYLQIWFEGLALGKLLGLNHQIRCIISLVNN